MTTSKSQILRARGLKPCPTLADCPAVYGDIEKDRLRPMPNGKPLTCTAVVQAVRLEDVGLRCP